MDLLCPECDHPVKVHRRGKCSAWLYMNERCGCEYDFDD